MDNISLAGADKGKYVTGGDALNREVGYLGQERAARKLLVDEGLASIEEIAFLSFKEVCCKLAEHYMIVGHQDESVMLIHKKDAETFESIVTYLSRQECLAMQIIIDLPDNLYQGIKDHKYIPYDAPILDAIREGVHLPESHGRLIDADEVADRKFYDEEIINSQLQTLHAKAIPVPEGATNGDVIKAMFPNCPIQFVSKISNRVATVSVYEDEDIVFGRMCFTKVWWNAPYRKE